MKRGKKQPNAWDSFRLYYQATKVHKGLFTLSMLQPLSMVGFSTITPYFASRVLAAAIQHGSGFWWQMLWLSITITVSIICNRIGFTAFMKLQAIVMYDLHRTAFSAVLARGLRFHTNTIGGKLVSDVTDFVSAYSPLTGALMINGGPLLANLLVGLVLISIHSWQLGLYLLLMVSITLVWAYRESRTRSSLRTTRLAASKAVVSHVSDSIVNAATVKTFAAEAREVHHNDSLARTLRDLRIKDWIRAGMSGNNRMAFLLFALLGLFVVLYTTTTRSSSSLSIGIFAFTYTLTLLLRLFDINSLTRQIEEIILQATPVTELLAEDIEVKDARGAVALEITKGAIDFDDISFAYTEKHSKQQVFTKLSLHIKPGEHVGLVGPSGGGKTTLTRLLLRFEDIQSGTIKIDGQDIRDITQASLRDAVGYVPQEPLLFHRSIAENIAYGKTAAKSSAISDAAALAYAADFIQKLPNKYNTIVGERGVKLSGGQRQRIAIARAILKEAPILVLDEATSALDSESEALIQNAIQELLKGRTALVIAHRLSTIQRMDRIIVMDEGRIVEEGTHAALLKKKNGTYARLWQHQSGGFIQE